MRETVPSGSVGGLAGNSSILPGQPMGYPYDCSTVNEHGEVFDGQAAMSRPARGSALCPVVFPEPVKWIA